MLHHLDRIFPEHLKSSPTLMNCYDALLKGVVTMFSVQVLLIRGRKIHQNFRIVIILPSTYSFPSSPESTRCL